MNIGNHLKDNILSFEIIYCKCKKKMKLSTFSQIINCLFQNIEESKVALFNVFFSVSWSLVGESEMAKLNTIP